MGCVAYQVGVAAFSTGGVILDQAARFSKAAPYALLHLIEEVVLGKETIFPIKVAVHSADRRTCSYLSPHPGPCSTNCGIRLTI